MEKERIIWKADSNMEFSTLSRPEAAVAMEKWKQSGYKPPKLGNEENKKLAEDFITISNLVNNEVNEIKRRKKYFTDVYMGLYIYEYFSRMENFNLRCASDEGFWNYLTLKIAPDIVAERWGKEKEERYWKKPARNWFRIMWWYVYMSWQGNIDDTRALLELDCFDTDTILNLAERTGRKGAYIDATRIIMRKWGQIYSNGKKINGDMFRTIMKLHTAEIMVVEPCLCENGVEGYVDSLIKNSGVDIDAASGN